MHLCAAKCKPRGECRQKGVGNPFFIQGNTAQFTAEALSVASLADFPATVTKMLANTQSIRCAFCLTCQKICRRDSTLRIVRCCPYFKASARTALRFLPSVEQRVQIGQQVVRQRGPLLLLAARRSEHRRFRGSSHRRCRRLLRALHFRLLLPGYRRRRGSLPLPGR